LRRWDQRDLSADGENRNAALFLWIDLRDYLPSDMTPLEGEKWLSQKLIDEGGVFISRSETFYGEHPGWFRIVFSLPDSEEGLRRYISFPSCLFLS
jgi:bifunctional pyridoxal-dependent enzyme with beta-cystathionase and maltose regulon repressor activities